MFQRCFTKSHEKILSPKKPLLFWTVKKKVFQRFFNGKNVVFSTM